MMIKYCRRKWNGGRQAFFTDAHFFLFLRRSISVFGNQLKSLRLHRHQLLPFEIYEENSIDGLLRGLTTQPAQEVDVSFSTEVRPFEVDRMKVKTVE